MNGRQLAGDPARSQNDIELALAATEEDDNLAFTLSKLDPSAAAAATQRQRLLSGPPSATLGKLWAGQGVKEDRRGRFLTGLVVFLVTLVLAAAVALIAGLLGGRAELAESGEAGHAHFYVIGDWGRQGLHNQTEVAKVMGQLAQQQAPEFIISTGDNFYMYGLSSAADDNFRSSFMNVYSAESLRTVPWHAVLGNHDYSPTAANIPSTCPHATNCFWSPLHELDSALAARDARWHCERSYQLLLAGGALEIFFIDTPPAISAYHNTSWASHLGGISQQSWLSQVTELEAQLARSAAAWKLVIGHHPVLSSGHHGNTPELLDTLDPVLRKYGVQAYLCGHDHHLEHLHVPRSRLHYIISGAGSEARELKLPNPQQVWGYAGSGFVAATLKPEELDLEFYGIVDGISKPVYVLSIPRA